MKRLFSLAVIVLLVLSGAAYAGTATYTFDSNPPPDWVNQAGSWIASSGVYYAQFPSNGPPTYAYLPFNLTDFVAEFDINGAADGGMWVHSSFNGAFGWANGILLVTKPDQIYWHDVVNNSYGGALDVGFMPSGNVHIKVVASGTTYEAYVNGSLATTHVAGNFTSGFPGLYDYSGQTFDNFTITGNGVPDAPLPGSIGLLSTALLGLAAWRTFSKN